MERERELRRTTREMVRTSITFTGEPTSKYTDFSNTAVYLTATARTFDEEIHSVASTKKMCRSEKVMVCGGGTRCHLATLFLWEWLGSVLPSARDKLHKKT